METLIIIIIYTFVVLVELVPMIKQKKAKESWLFSILTCISFTILILYSLRIEIPSPADFIEGIVEGITKIHLIGS